MNACAYAPATSQPMLLMGSSPSMPWSRLGQLSYLRYNLFRFISELTLISHALPASAGRHMH